LLPFHPPIPSFHAVKNGSVATVDNGWLHLVFSKGANHRTTGQLSLAGTSRGLQSNPVLTEGQPCDQTRLLRAFIPKDFGKAV